MPKETETPSVNREQLVEQINQELVRFRDWLNKRQWRGSEERLIMRDGATEPTLAQVKMIRLSYMLSLRHSWPTETAMHIADDAKLYRNDGQPFDLLSLPTVKDGYADPLQILLATLRRTRGA